MIQKKYWVAFTLSALLLAACHQKRVVLPADEETAAPSKTEAPASSSEAVILPEVIKIGFMAPLTGNAGNYGQDVKAATELYFKENPTIGGKQVEVIYEDSKCNGQDAANAAQKLITIDKVQIILGGSCSGETLAAAPIAEANKVVILSQLSSSPAITTAGDYVFRDYPSDAQVGAALVDDLAKKGFKKAALLTEQTDYAQAYRGVIQERLKTYPEIALAVDEAYAVDNTDFRTLLSKVKDSQADVLVSVAQTPVTNGFIVRQTHELGLNIQIYGTDTIDGTDFFATAKDVAEGILQAVVVENPARQSYQDFVKRMPTPQASPIFQALAYDAAGIAAQAIAQAGYDGTKIKEYLYQMPSYAGVGGDHKFDSNGDDQLAAGIKIAKNGKFILQTKE